MAISAAAKAITLTTAITQGNRQHPHPSLLGGGGTGGPPKNPPNPRLRPPPIPGSCIPPPIPGPPGPCGPPPPIPGPPGPPGPRPRIILHLFLLEAADSFVGAPLYSDSLILYHRFMKGSLTKPLHGVIIHQKGATWKILFAKMKCFKIECFKYVKSVSNLVQIIDTLAVPCYSEVVIDRQTAAYRHRNLP